MKSNFQITLLFCFLSFSVFFKSEAQENTARPNFIFYLSGVDIMKSDKLGRLSLSIEGCKERDKIVFSNCKKNDIPVQCSMGGGYSQDIDLIVDAHFNTFKTAKEIFIN